MRHVLNRDEVKQAVAAFMKAKGHAGPHDRQEIRFYVENDPNGKPALLTEVIVTTQGCNNCPHCGWDMGTQV